MSRFANHSTNNNELTKKLNFKSNHLLHAEKYYINLFCTVIYTYRVNGMLCWHITTLHNNTTAGIVVDVEKPAILQHLQ